ncbi:N-formylglutamate amidohydrolase [Limobrevibacterium gyesilva]|uniref:N-formylglutamate amidohydrolase n=1 Tax=Limobrevibacterium gyesilva TaxID=2991712 RepID=A0AA41YRM7_9PROT|nr:N-formylglutamate amidohydrolase [Limobrevibacterium gyesilva]MCW3477058.1 N-formylglutamate amidohydrolase [Limobrevibacterium gyesilva]
MTTQPETILAADEPDPVMIGRPQGASPFFLACDHAARRIPRSLGTLGLPDSERERHIAWDIGIWGVSERVAAALDTVLIGQAYSRLVIDCNRPTSSPTSIPEISESTVIPGNAGLTEAHRQARIREIFAPYHRRFAAELDARAGRPTVLVAMHSFTPVYKGVARPWHAGVLFNQDLGLSRIMLDLLRAEGDLVVGENQPYSVSGTSDYSAPVHAEARGLPYLELEIRQDLIADAAGQQLWAERLIRLLPEAWRRFAAARKAAAQ